MRHILALSGGKDSTAMALHLHATRPTVPYEYVFCDTDREFPDLYRFLDDLSGYLQAPIHRLNDYGRGFDYYLPHWGYFLPGKASRWCTSHLKIRPFERYCKTSLPCTVYIGIRADEDESRGNYGLTTGIEYAYPLREDGLGIEEVEALLATLPFPVPDFYAWRSTGGCYMCPWQRDQEWIDLRHYHPALFAQAVAEEKLASETSTDGYNATWSIHRIPLTQLADEYDRQGQLFDRYAMLEKRDRRPCLICAK